MKLARERWAILTIGALLAALYFITAVRQRNELNLSRTAGGQYPYFHNAERMAKEGLDDYLGDRNRMPLVPALLSLMHCDDSREFFNYGTLFAIASSAALVALLATVFYTTLPPWTATFLTALTAIHVHLPKAAFVQAELFYYAFFFATWLAMCGLIRRPRWQLAVVAGVAMAAAYYSKASALPMLALFVVTTLPRAALRALSRKRGSSQAAGERASYDLLCTVITVGSFLLLSLPYLHDNKIRFGRFFYNVNSTFFMWMDSWEDAQRFAERFDIDDHYPDAQPPDIPSPSNYLATHSMFQIADRLGYGITTLAGLAVRTPYSKYALFVLCACLVLCVSYPAESRRILHGYQPSIVFTALVVVGYGVAYSWYAVVSYGDRFILSLYLPVVFSLTWLCVRISAGVKPLWIGGRQVGMMEGLSCALVFLLLIEGLRMATVALPRPNEHFVQFYFNESREAQLRGDLLAAVDGYRGVLKVEPTFAPAHHELAIVALHSGRPEEAIESARNAVEVAPGDANYLNTYGSALVQAGHPGEAVVILERAVAADPSFASAWYNLAGAYITLDQEEKASYAMERLEMLDARLAEQLRRLVPKN